MIEPIHPMFDPANLSDQEGSRLRNLAGLRAAGIEPYPARVQRTHTIAAARAQSEENGDVPLEVTVTGRIKRVRNMGKLSFADIEDETGTLQIVLRKGNLSDAIYDEVWRKLVDLGDFVGAAGPLFVTKTGELSVEVKELQFLSKTLKPMPDKWHGVRDQEKRYRRRYVDLLANPPVRDVFRSRAAILRALRAYLDREGFLEVETPILQPIYGGAAARPFVTHHNQ